MVQMYTVLGRQVGSHYLAMAVLGTFTGGIMFATRGGSAAKKTQGPPINASSPDEEAYIKDFLKNIEGDAKKADKPEAAKH